MRPRSDSLSLRFKLGELTSPNDSSLIICSSAFSFLSNSSCSPSCRSASSAFSAASSESEPEESGEVGLSALKSLLWPCSVRIDDEDVLLARAGELLVNELRRARTPRGVVRRTEEESLEILDIRPDSRRTLLGLSTGDSISSPDLGDTCVAEGLNAPVISCSPRRSCSYRVCAL